MKEVTLSAHVEDRLAEAQQAVEAARQALHRAEIEGLEIVDRWERARAEKAWWRRALRLESSGERAARHDATQAKQRLEETTERSRQAADGRAAWASGQQGERVLPERYRCLDGNWTMFNGCRNSKGEIDHLLLGPSGLWAIEVKNEKVVLDVRGDRWWGRFLDQYGNVVEERPAADRKGTGRTWGRQVAEPAAMLHRELTRRNASTSIRTAVVLVGDLGRVAARVDPGVDLLTDDLAELDQAVFAGEPALDAERRQRLHDLIVGHHEYHERRRNERRRR